MTLKVLIVFVCGGLGSALRYLAAVGLRAWSHPPANPPEPDPVLALLPLSTLGVNVLGCLAIGLASPALQGLREEVRLAVIVGLLGGFTTFSAFGHETVTLLGHGRGWWAGVYVVASVTLGVGAALLGHTLGSRLWG